MTNLKGVQKTSKTTTKARATKKSIKTSKFRAAAVAMTLFVSIALVMASLPAQMVWATQEDEFAQTTNAKANDEPLEPDETENALKPLETQESKEQLAQASSFTVSDTFVIDENAGDQTVSQTGHQEKTQTNQSENQPENQTETQTHN
ncbi:MAG: hypothetical protein LBG97_01840, partial [Coriobacteriales bacterium]|nr:hypothetical protein [Coriobacteriales bacterium]